MGASRRRSLVAVESLKPRSTTSSTKPARATTSATPTRREECNQTPSPCVVGPGCDSGRLVRSSPVHDLAIREIQGGSSGPPRPEPPPLSQQAIQALPVNLLAMILAVVAIALGRRAISEGDPRGKDPVVVGIVVVLYSIGTFALGMLFAYYRVEL